MLRKHNSFSIIFALIFVLHLVAIAMDQSFLTNVTKPLIVISLLIYFYNISRLNNSFHKKIFSGLLFSLAGDILLIFAGEKPDLFIAGLVAFLIAQLCYITAFYSDFNAAPGKNKGLLFASIIVFGVFCFSLYNYLSPTLGDLKIPVLVYAIIISSMAVFAANRFGRVNRVSFIMVFMGAIFFLASDTALAINKFSSPYAYSGIVIMATYMLAQYYITRGALERGNNYKF